MGKQEEYLNRVLERLKSETEFKVVPNDEPVGHKYDYYWKYPFSEFTALSPYYPTNKSSNFHKHCRDIYGLSNEEIEDYILPNYYNWFKYNNPIYKFSNVETLFKNTTINESVDKQKEFLDKVLDRIVKDTKIDDSKITFPFANFKQPELSSDSLLSVSTWIDGRWENHKYPGRFKKYCNDIYGVTYEESLILWRRYVEIIEEEVSRRLKRPSSGIRVATTWNMGRHDINESTNKQKEFLDKVVQHMIERFKDDEENKWQSVDMKSFVDFGETFGLTDLELNYVYHKYFFLKGWNEKDISSWYLDKNTSVSLRNRLMNESHVDVLPYMDDTEFIKNFTKDLNEKQKGYLDKVVEHLLRETDIDYEKWRINYPFFKDTTYSFQYTLPFSGPFIRYCNNIFPLSEDEMRYVHFIYTGIIHSKIRKYYVDNDIYNKYYNVMGTKDIINFDR